MCWWQHARCPVISVWMCVNGGRMACGTEAVGVQSIYHSAWGHIMRPWVFAIRAVCKNLCCCCRRRKERERERKQEKISTSEWMIRVQKSSRCHLLSGGLVNMLISNLDWEGGTDWEIWGEINQKEGRKVSRGGEAVTLRDSLDVLRWCWIIIYPQCIAYTCWRLRVDRHQQKVKPPKSGGAH